MEVCKYDIVWERLVFSSANYNNRYYPAVLGLKKWSVLLGIRVVFVHSSGRNNYLIQSVADCMLLKYCPGIVSLHSPPSGMLWMVASMVIGQSVGVQYTTDETCQKVGSRTDYSSKFLVGKTGHPWARRWSDQTGQHQCPVIHNQPWNMYAC